MSRYWFCVFNGVQSSSFVSSRIRNKLLRAVGIACHHSAVVYEQTFLGSEKLRIGPKAFVSVNCTLDGSDWIDIGENVYLAPGVTVLTSSHEIGPPAKRAGANTNAPVTIKRGSWIGSRATINPGVTIGEGCFIASGALVTKDCEANGLYVGIPARRVRDLPED